MGRNRIAEFLLPYRPAQPTPRKAIVNELSIGGMTMTSIARTWAPGDGANCRLCPSGACTLSRDGALCLVMLEGRTRGDLLFEPVGLVAVAPGCYMRAEEGGPTS